MADQPDPKDWRHHYEADDFNSLGFKIFEDIKAKAVELWEDEADLDFLRKLALEMAEYSFMISQCEKTGNINAVESYSQTLSMVATQIEGRQKELKYKMKSAGWATFKEIISEVAAFAIKAAISAAG